MHYRLKFLRGRLYKKQPEIVFDTPRRVQTDQLPVVLVIKDAHWFPVTLRETRIAITSSFDDSICEKQVFNENIPVNKRWFTRTYFLDVYKFRDHLLDIDCEAVIEYNGRSVVIRNDNYTGLSQAPFKVFIDPDPLPGEKGWEWGDLHCHSSWTTDQVEFGLPPAAIPDLARSMGVSFCGLAEHSYDLDDLPDSWTKNDPFFHKWKDYLTEINSINASNPSFRIIPGEEVSVDNGLGRNVHLAVLNNPEFFPGSGDGLEKSIGFPSGMSYPQVLEKAGPQALLFAAHPFTHPPFLQWLIARRGVWNRHDQLRRLNGWQILNGCPAHDFEVGRRFWIEKLLTGSHTYIYAGNDAHGNFNRFRQIRIPLLSMYEHEHQVFGEFLTGVQTEPGQGIDKLTAELITGPVIVSNGPFINMIASGHNQQSYHIGENLPATPLKLKIFASSTRYFGKIRRINIFCGNLTTSNEILLKTFEFIHGTERQIIALPIDIYYSSGYFRAEIVTQSGKFGLTNPIWFGNPGKSRKW